MNDRCLVAEIRFDVDEVHTAHAVPITLALLAGRKRVHSCAGLRTRFQQTTLTLARNLINDSQRILAEFFGWIARKKSAHSVGKLARNDQGVRAHMHSKE